MKSQWLSNEAKATAIAERLETVIAICLELDGKPSVEYIKAFRTMRKLDKHRWFAAGRRSMMDEALPCGGGE